jgi:integrase
MSIRWREHPKGSGKGSWYCQIENKEVYGNKRGPAKSGFAKKSAAKEWEEQTIAEAKERKGMADKRGATIGKLAEAYKHHLDDRVEAGTLKASTRRLLLIGVKNEIVPRYGHKKCDEFCTDMAQAMIRDYKGHDGKCHNTMRSLRGMIAHGVRKGYLISNPFEHDKPEMPPVCRRGDDEMPTADELIQLRQIVQQARKPAQDEREWLQDQAFFFLGLHHGLRRGEVTALRRPEVCGREGVDVDLKNGVLNIRYSFCNVTSKLKETKSERGERKIEMTTSMWEMMDRLLHMPAANGCGFAFTSRRGADYYGQLGYRWAALMTKAALMIEKDNGNLLPRFDFHSLRHVLGSILLAQHKPITFCARVLGHTPMTFLKAYAREIAQTEGSTRDALQLAERVFGGERIPLLENAAETQIINGNALKTNGST